VISVQHTIDRREVEAKKALPKEESPVSKDQAAVAAGHRTKKIFVGGLAATVDEDAFRAYFQQFGRVEDAVVMFDHENKRPRGFGFITFSGAAAMGSAAGAGAEGLVGAVAYGWERLQQQRVSVAAARLLVNAGRRGCDALACHPAAPLSRRGGGGGGCLWARHHPDHP
jgi:hypothetical protein